MSNGKDKKKSNSPGPHGMLKVTSQHSGEVKVKKRKKKKHIKYQHKASKYSYNKDKKEPEVRQLKPNEFTPQQLREIKYARERLAREVKARQEGKQEYGAYGKREREPEIRPKKSTLTKETTLIGKVKPKEEKSGFWHPKGHIERGSGPWGYLKKGRKEYGLKKRKKTAKKKKTTKTLARRPALPH